VREDATAYRVANGALELDTTAGEVGDTAKNLIGQPIPGGAWEAETKIDLTTTLEGQQAGTLRFILVGVALMLIVIFRPQGIFGNKRELTFVK